MTYKSNRIFFLTLVEASLLCLCFQLLKFSAFSQHYQGLSVPQCRFVTCYWLSVLSVLTIVPTQVVWGTVWVLLLCMVPFIFSPISPSFTLFLFSLFSWPIISVMLFASFMVPGFNPWDPCGGKRRRKTDSVELFSSLPTGAGTCSFFLQ